MLLAPKLFLKDLSIVNDFIVQTRKDEMSTRVFEDKTGKSWVVTKTGSSMEVKGRRDEETNLYDIAISCASKLGVTKTKNGIPLEYINEHRRIWNTIWYKGQDTKTNDKADSNVGCETIKKQKRRS
jgi:hypothetical protein